jgi:hypothetical protein
MAKEHFNSADARVIEFIQTRVVEAGLEELRQSKPRTYVINPKVPTPINGQYEVLSIRGTGRMKEFMVRSDVANFTVRVKVDGETLYEDTWADLNAISQPVGEIAAFQDENGKYIVHLEDIDFKEELIINLYGIFTAERYFLKYDLYPPRGRRFLPMENTRIRM